MKGRSVPDADRIAAAVGALSAVVRLHGGTFGEVATYLPGRRVTGVQVGEQRIAIHLVALLGPPVHQAAEAVRAAVTPLAEGMPVDVVIEDVAVQDEDGDEHATAQRH